MTKIVRYDGNLAAFASTATGTERTVFGAVTQSDVLDANINTEFFRGWGIVGVNDAPSKQDFNGLAYTLSQLLAYIHQMGVPEWNTSQEYHIGSVTTTGGIVYVSLTNTNVGNNPATDFTNWNDISRSEDRAIVQTTDATVTPIVTLALAEDSCVIVKAMINGLISDSSACCGATIQYTARRAGAGAVEVSAPIINIQEDSAAAPIVDADVNGNNLRLTVKGVALEVWDWSCSYQSNIIV